MSVKAMKFEGLVHVFCQCDKCKAEKQEPVAWMDEETKTIYWHDTHKTDDYHRLKRTTPLYAYPPKREWVPLTDEQIKEIIGPYGGPIKGYTRALFDKIDAKLRENNK
jgi:hypothetical protein